MGGCTYRVGQTSTSPPKWLMWTRCNSLQISSFKCLIYPSCLENFLSFLHLLAVTSAASLAAAPAVQLSLESWHRSATNGCLKAFIICENLLCSSLKRRKPRIHFGFLCIHKLLCMQLQCAVTCMDEYLHAQLLHTLTWGFAYPPSHQRLISVVRAAWLWVLSCTQTHMLKK